jgi:hypothetical protein
MGCSCGKKKSTPDSPIVLGEPTGKVIEAVATVTLLGARAGERVWATGSQVPALIAGGWLRPVE